MAKSEDKEPKPTYEDLLNKINVLEKKLLILEASNEDLSKTIEFLQVKIQPESEKKSGLLITVNHSVRYSDVSYSHGSIIENIKESDLKELSKYGELV